MSSNLILLANLTCTLFLTGLIWFVQIVHYPLFGSVPSGGFAAYATAHQRLTSFVVILPMVLELLTSIALAVHPPQGIDGRQGGIALAMAAGVWAATFLLSVPQHRLLAGGFDERAHSRLVASNWIRTLLWSMRAALLLSWMVKLLR